MYLMLKVSVKSPRCLNMLTDATTRRVINILLAVLLVSILFLGAADAQPARARIIKQVTVSEQADKTEFNIGFIFPVRYVRHFPTDYGETIEIQLKAVLVSEDDADLLGERESIRLPDASYIPLLDISYEGDLPGGPYLTVRFLKPVAYKVQQGADFRSLLVTVYNNDTTGSD